MPGLLEHYGLTHWWYSSLTIDERERIESAFSPMGSTNRRPLTSGNVGREVGDTATATSLVATLIGWLRTTPLDLAIRRKLREKVRQLVETESSVVSRHFALQVLIGEFYRDRETDPLALQNAIEVCLAQIKLAPRVARSMKVTFKGSLPRHVGYEQLAIILEKARDYTAAIKLCEEAKSAGWDSDWDKRIARCRKRMEKPSSRARGA
jgi:hypothetical protein